MDTTTNPAYPTPDQAQLIVAGLTKAFEAWVSLTAGTSGMREQEVFTVDLSAAQTESTPLSIPFAFRSLLIRDASDNNASIMLKPYTQDTYQGSSKLRNNTLWESGDFPCPKAYLWWPAQPGKTVTLEFHLHSRVTPGNTQQTSYITEGSSATSNAVKTVTTTAAALLATDTDRKVTTVQNQGSVSIYVGGSTVTAPGGASPGIEIGPGQNFQWKNTGALYAITASVSNALIATLDEK